MPIELKFYQQGQRHAHGAILKLFNIVDRHGISGLSLPDFP